MHFTQKLKLALFLLAVVVPLTHLCGQTQPGDSTYRRFFVGSTFFVLGNLIPDDPNPPGFVQLNFGIRLSPRNVVSIEAKTWKYAWPLGIPFGPTFQAPDEKYPGYVRSYGIALAYQRYFWKGAYAALHAMNALQRYSLDDGNKIQNGYQLFITFRAGYHVELFNNRFFIEPSAAVTHWPINTRVPDSFAKLEGKWPNYFLFEPGLHFGVKF